MELPFVRLVWEVIQYQWAGSGEITPRQAASQYFLTIQVSDAIVADARRLHPDWVNMNETEYFANGGVEIFPDTWVAFVGFPDGDLKDQLMKDYIMELVIYVIENLE